EDSYDEEEIPGTLSTRPPTPLEWYARHRVSPRLFMLPHFFWGCHKLALMRYQCSKLPSSGCLSGFAFLLLVGCSLPIRLIPLTSFCPIPRPTQAHPGNPYYTPISVCYASCMLCAGG
ncbi:hypothetical protein HYDPIDRAFT_119612, partial [Hydnomerulius pinastri MD-312]